MRLSFSFTTGNYERPRHEADFGTGADEPGCAAGPHEESDDKEQDPEAGQCRHYPNTVEGKEEVEEETGVVMMRGDRQEKACHV
jgi:hypothetical protein